MGWIVHEARKLRGLVLPLLLLSAWEIFAHEDAAHSYVFTPLETVWSAAVEYARSGELWSNWLASCQRTATGFAIGAVIGIALGGLMTFSRIADAIIHPVYHAIRQVPLIGLIPLISLWFGNDESSKLLIVSLAAFYPTLLNTYEGLHNAETRYLRVGAVFKLSRFQMLRHVRLPSAMPSIFTGLMQATAFAWLSSIAAELFFNPGPGLGNLMLNGQAAFRMDVVILSVIGIGLTGFAFNFLIAVAARRALRWRSVR